MDKRSNTRRIYMFFVMLMLFFIFLIFYLNKQFISNSDIDEHFRFALDLRLLPTMGIQQFSQEISFAHILSYPGWHLLFLTIYFLIEKLHMLFGYSVDVQNVAMWAQAIENALLLVITFAIIVECFAKYYGLSGKAALILGTIDMFIGPIYIPGISKDYYLGQFTANPWHNPTTLIVKPVALMCFFIFCYLYNNRDSIPVKKQNKLCVCLAFGLMLSAWLKPSFYQAFVPALFIFCVIDVLSTKFASFKFCVKIGFGVLPVCLLALLQYIISFKANRNGIIWSPWTVWNFYSTNKGMSLLVSLAFPMIVMLFNGFKVIKNADILLSLCFLMSSVLQFICLGFTVGGLTGDFLWAVYLSVLMLFIPSENIMLQMKQHKIKFSVCSIILLLHFLCGLGYFIGSYMEGTFRI